MDAWLTEILLTRRHKHVTYDSGAVHRWLTRAAEGPYYLWASPRPGTLIVQSARPLARDTLAGTMSVHATRISLDYEAGARVSVAGILAPTRATWRGPQRPGKIGPIPDEELPAWALRKLGPTLGDISFLRVQQLSPSRGQKLDGTQLTHARAAVSCIATVTDPGQFAHMLAEGVGRGKRFGAGLLLAREVTV